VEKPLQSAEIFAMDVDGFDCAVIGADRVSAATVRVTFLSPLTNATAERAFIELAEAAADAAGDADVIDYASSRSNQLAGAALAPADEDRAARRGGPPPLGPLQQQMHPKVFASDAPPDDFLEVLDRTGCYVLNGCLTAEGSEQLEAEMYATGQAQKWTSGRQNEAVRNGPLTRERDTLTLSPLSMLVRGPVDADAASGVSLWPAPGTACFELIDAPLVTACCR
jgi:hypothetical protein